MLKQPLGAILWLTGLSGAGKSTLATHLARELESLNYPVEVLDGDDVRTWLTPGLGYSKADRDLNVQIVGRVAHLLSRNGIIVIVALISPYRQVRNQLKTSSHNFLEIYVNAPLAVCEARDVKGLYAKARSQEIREFTGLSAPYEPPETPEIICNTAQETVTESVAKIVESLVHLGLVSC